MRLVLSTASILALVPVALHAQLQKVNALELETGTRARILGAAPDSKFTLITVASAGPDSLRYSLAGSSKYAIARLATNHQNGCQRRTQLTLSNLCQAWLIQLQGPSAAHHPALELQCRN